MRRTLDQQALLTRMRAVVSGRPDHVAVREFDRAYTYAEFGQLIHTLHAALGRAGGNSGGPVGLLLDRSALAYSAMWASIGHGRAYVPLNTSYPHSRLQNIVEQADITTMVCDPSTRSLAMSFGIAAECVVVALPDMCLSDAGTSDRPWWQARAGRDVAYILFTSGSTGQPKGVPISHGNLLAFIDNMHAVLKYTDDDVCSQVCELSFDFSVHEIYLALLNGCTLCPARRVDLFNPAHYIASRSVTVWIAVPSLARVILDNGVPTGQLLHRIRLSVFNGEALTAKLAAAWREVAPNAQIWNSYGPTECTVAVSTQQWSGEPELDEADVIAIGTPFPDCETALLIDTHIVRTCEAADRSTGELLLAGPQRFSGYTDPELESPFVTDGRATRYYRTGDHVRWRAGRLYHLGRTDDQVKIGGHRIELLEVEYRLRRCLDTESLAVIAHPAKLPLELVLFVAGLSEPPALRSEALGLPGHMIPKRTILLDRLPTNTHGKLDRAALHTFADTER